MSLDIWSFAVSMPQKPPLFWRHESQKKLSSMLYPWKQLFLHLPMMTEQLTHIEEMVHINVDLRKWYEKFAQELHSSRNHYFSHKKKKNEVSVLLQKRIQTSETATSIRDSCHCWLLHKILEAFLERASLLKTVQNSFATLPIILKTEDNNDPKKA